MKFGLGTPALILYPPVVSPWEATATGADILRVARKADELGYDWMVVPEHIFIPQEMLEIMGPRYPEAMTAAAVLAGATQRINILTYILVLPYRDPVILAKQIATLDFLSNGRFMLGTASGHMEREFDVLKVPYKERGARTDEYLRVMKSGMAVKCQVIKLKSGYCNSRGWGYCNARRENIPKVYRTENTVSVSNGIGTC